jgi:pyruvate,water dikinase
VLDRLSESPQWKEDSLLTLLRRRAIRRLAHETPDRLRLREQSKAALLVLGGMVRRLHLEAGRRLVEAGMLGEPADVDLLTPAELRSALREGATLLPDELARRRRRLTRWSQEGALPARFTGRPESVPVDDLDGDRLDGWAASRGRFRGRATVVDTPTGELEPGSVLVAEATDPSWSPLFMKAGAIVLDRGGPLSHAAILARELGVPAVLNVPGATTLLAGREVTVDGDAGVILLHDAATDHPPGNEVRP